MSFCAVFISSYIEYRMRRTSLAYFIRSSFGCMCLYGYWLNQVFFSWQGRRFSLCSSELFSINSSLNKHILKSQGAYTQASTSPLLSNGRGKPLGPPPRAIRPLLQWLCSLQLEATFAAISSGCS